MPHRLKHFDTCSFVEKIYMTGGYVRDLLRNVECNDIDYTFEVTEAEFEAEFPTFKKIMVDNKFPVYYDHLGNECALTREEEFNGAGDANCDVTAVGVTIEKDVFRRDFTVCSLAMKYTTKEIIDLVGGVEDINAKLLRTVNDNFVIDDANRVYRLARFASTLGFDVENSTAEIVNRDREYVKLVTPERVLKELQKAYKQSEKPSVFFRTLDTLGVLGIHFAPIAELKKHFAGPNHTHHGDETSFEHTMNVIDRCKELGYSFDCFLGCLFHDIGKNITSLSEDYIDGRHHYGHEYEAQLILDLYLPTMRVTVHQHKLITCVARNHMIHGITAMRPVKLVRFFKRVKHLVTDFISCCNCDYPITEEQLIIFHTLYRTFRETEINVPKEILKKGNVATISFVESKYAHKYKELIRCS